MFIKDWLGVPYREGGRSKKGVDCVGLLLEYLNYRGIRMERVDYLYVMTKLRDFVIRVKDIKAGDIVLIQGDKDFVNHVGIAVDENRMIHAIKSCGVVITPIEKDMLRGVYRLK